jgi:hypothetical protein
MAQPGRAASKRLVRGADKRCDGEPGGSPPRQRKSGAFGGDYMHLAWKYSEAHVHLYEICNDIHIYTQN